MDKIELEGMPRAATLRLVASEGQVLVAWGNCQRRVKTDPLLPIEF